MQSLQNRLKQEIQQNSKLKIMESFLWCVPIHTIEVEYKRIKRTKMDVLMKIMLISFQKTDITSSMQLSELLLVENLFIDDLIDVMKKSGLIEKEEDSISLTSKGIQQLEEGIFEEEQEPGTQNILYSPSHEAFLKGEIKPASEGEELLEVYRYAKEEKKKLLLEDRLLLEAVEESKVEVTEGDAPLIIISEIITSSELYIDDIPCLEYIVYNESDDLFFARVWNTLTDRWDEVLEEQLNEKERLNWRKKYLN
ncbi:MULTISPECIES: hypothetical protein [Psychrobacillus]|uniref:DUF4364 family protein n=2 Tax=Psychrobacillus TaxID=1221880 RepID=A0ABR8R8S5_9BACI|nr:hypothetical protein [Psychrobacillus faecigallinarum]MBD7944205.1 hypothetical protein [Psychrobacillus faecigallinarum]QGM31580.1 hypothetical protein GI482_14845 [Bacillus sp. N3536]